MKLNAGFMCLALCAGVSIGEPIEWLSARSGFWDDASRWSTGTVPGNFDDILIDVPGLYSVLVTGTQSVQGVELLSSQASLDLLSGSDFRISGDVTNNGLIGLNPKLSVVSAKLELDGDITFNGAGELRLNALDITNPILETRFISQSFVNGVGHTLSGGGQIAGDFTNLGFLIADLPLVPLQLKDLDATNESLMLVKSGCTLSLDITDVTQGASGLVQIAGPGAELHIRGQISGGRVETLLGGIVRGDGGVFEGVDVGEKFEVYLEDSLTLIGCALQDAELILDGPGALFLREGTQLLGAGVIWLGSSEGNRTDIFTSFETDIESDYTIRGAGKFRSSGRFVNRSRFHANVEGEVLELQLLGQLFVNEFELRSSMGGVLFVHGFVAQGTGASVISDGSTSVVDLSGATIQGGRIESVAGGRFVCDTGNLGLSDVQFDADIDVSGYLSVSGSLINNGTMTADRLFSSSEGVVLDGPGEIVLLGGNSEIGYPFETEGIFNSAEHTISGYGELLSPLENAGLISADIPGETLRLDVFDVPNSGVIQAISGARVELEARVEQTDDGEIRAIGSGSEVVLSAANLVKREIVGGTIRTSEGGLIRLADRLSFRDVHIQGDVLFDAFGVMDIDDGVTLDGTMIIDPVDVQFFGAAMIIDTEEMIQGNAVIRLVRDDGFSLLANNSANMLATFGPGIRIEGLGVIRANIRTHGTLAPGLPLGAFNVEAPVVMADDATIEIQVSDLDHDRVMSNSPFEFGGTLEIRFVDGFSPDGFWSRIVLESPEIYGNFEQIEAPVAPHGLVTRAYNSGTELLVGQTCLADINLDGVLDFFDVSVFLDTFESMNSVADLTGEGVFDFFDVSAFLSAFSAGCP